MKKILLTLAAVLSSAVVSQAGMILNLTMSEGSGQTLNSGVGSNSAAGTNLGWSNDLSLGRYVVNFNGTSASAAMATAVQGNSVEIWYKPSSRNGVLYQSYEGNGESLRNNRQEISPAPWVFVGNGVTGHEIYSEPTSTLGQWNQFVFSFDAANSGAVKLYLNGAQVTYTSDLSGWSSVLSANTNYASLAVAYNTIIGRDVYNQYFSGQIASIKVWDDTLSGTDVSNSFASGVPVPEPAGISILLLASLGICSRRR